MNNALDLVLFTTPLANIMEDVDSIRQEYFELYVISGLYQKHIKVVCIIFGIWLK